MYNFISFSKKLEKNTFNIYKFNLFWAIHFSEKSAILLHYCHKLLYVLNINGHESKPQNKLISSSKLIQAFIYQIFLEVDFLHLILTF